MAETTEGMLLLKCIVTEKCERTLQIFYWDVGLTASHFLRGKLLQVIGRFCVHAGVIAVMLPHGHWSLKGKAFWLFFG